MIPSLLNAQDARILRTMRRLRPKASDMDLKVWLRSHTREKEDQEFSRMQEKAWLPYMPGSPDTKSQKGAFFSVTSAGGRGAPVRAHSAPMFPGEYRANRDDVQALSVQNLKEMATASLRSGEQFHDKSNLLLKISSLDYEKIEELVSNLFPFMERDETNALLQKVIEAVQLNSPSQKTEEVYRHMTSEMLQLQGYPQTFAAMVEAISRRRSSKAFKVQEARKQFFEDLNFNWEHLQQIRRNSQQMGERYTSSVPDIVDVVFDLYREYIAWLEKKDAGSDEDLPAAKKRVPIGERVVIDGKLQYAYGTGYRRTSEAIVRIRENANGSGKMSINGSIPIAYFRSSVYPLEMVLQPFDEADLNVFDFDIDVEVFSGSEQGQAGAIRMALSNALVKLLPHTKHALHMASFLFADQGLNRQVKFTGQRAPGANYHWVKRGNPLKQFA